MYREVNLKIPRGICWGVHSLQTKYRLFIWQKQKQNKIYQRYYGESRQNKASLAFSIDRLAFISQWNHKIQWKLDDARAHNTKKYCKTNGKKKDMGRHKSIYKTNIKAKIK